MICLLYTSGHDNDAWNEKQRLDDYFRAVAETVECKYPEDLHTNKRNTNGYNVKLMKTELQATLPEFFQQCTYKGMPIGKYKRHGQYRICLLYTSYKGVKIIEGELMTDHVHMLVLIPPKIRCV